MYNNYVLALVTICYSLSELGRFLIGSTSKVMAKDLHFGDISCQFNSSELFPTPDVHTKCERIHDLMSCESLKENNTNYCEWTYNGLGLEYQVLAGPIFVIVYTIFGIVMGVMADKFNRVKLLAICICIFSIAIVLMGAVQQYWQLIVLRMVMAVGNAGCNPLATGILSDIFPADRRGFAIAIFNWGVIIGYGVVFPIGKYIPELNLWDLGWRMSYFGSGVTGIVFALVFWTTLRDPTRKVIGEELNANCETGDETLWTIFKQPRIILLCIAASIRNCGGMVLSYNLDLYYRKYFPDADLGWWLCVVTTITGIIGIAVGGIVSDRFVMKRGVKSRVIILALSQLIATVPTAASLLILHPLWAMLPLGVAYFFSIMWYGLIYTVIVEIIPLKIRSTTIGIFIFIFENIGGSLAVLVDPVSKLIGYRESIIIFYPGAFLLSSLIFFSVVLFINGPNKQSKNKHGCDNQVYEADCEKNNK